MLSVVQLGSSIDGLSSVDDADGLIDRAIQLAGPGETPVGDTTIDLGPRMRPFRANDLSIPWPGEAWQAGGTVYQLTTNFDPKVTARPTYEHATLPDGGKAPAFAIQPVGLVGAGGGAVGAGGISESDTEQAYRSWSVEKAPVTQGFVPAFEGDRPFVFAPVGAFDLGTLDLPTDPISYAPLGAYDQPDTTVIANPSGSPVSPQPMSPTLNPAGLLDVPPLAIADLNAAEALRGNAPIDAIRVRVAGLTNFNSDATAKVERVASAIASLGLDVDIVAGSSPQSVDIYVPAYRTESSPPSDLGWVEQHWTTLGAANRVVAALSDTNMWLLLLATVAVMVVIVGVQLVDATTRTREIAVLGAVGWSRGQVVRWIVAESLVASAIIAPIGGIAWVALGRDPLGMVATAAAVLLFPVTGLCAGLIGTRVDPDKHRTQHVPRRWPVRSLHGYATRTLFDRPWRSLAIIIGLAVAAAAIAPAAALILAIGARVGPTLLAADVSAHLQGFQVAMLGLAACGGVGFVILGLRRDLGDRSTELEILVVSGWTPAMVSRMWWWQRVALCVPAAAMALVFVFFDAEPIAGDVVDPFVVALLASGIALSGIAWGGAFARIPARDA